MGTSVKVLRYQKVGYRKYAIATTSTSVTNPYRNAFEIDQDEVGNVGKTTTVSAKLLTIAFAL